METRYGYKNHNETLIRLIVSKGLRLLAFPFDFIQAGLNVVADIVIDRRRHVYKDVH